MSTAETPSICRICKGNCGILIREDARVTHVRGNPDHPVSKGFICFRGRNYGEVHRAQDRLTQPLLRRGSKWTPLSYDDALGETASALQRCKVKHGPQSVAFLKGESLKHQEIADYLRHLAYGFGTPNYASVGSTCNRSMTLAYSLTTGGMIRPDLDRVRTIVVWGANPAVSGVFGFSRVRDAVSRGTKSP